MNIQGLNNLDQTISTLEGIIRLQKQNLLGFYNRLKELSVEFYRSFRGTTELNISGIFLQLIKDESEGTTKGREIFVARLILRDITSPNIVQRQSAERKRQSAARKKTLIPNSFSLAKAEELQQSLWHLAGGIECELVAHIAETMKEVAVDVGLHIAGREFFDYSDDGFAIKGKELRSGFTRELGRLSSDDEVDGRNWPCREVFGLSDENE